MRNRRILALAFSLAALAACEREPPTAAAPLAGEDPDSGGHPLAAATEGVFDSIVHPARGRIDLTISTRGSGPTPFPAKTRATTGG